MRKLFVSVVLGMAAMAAGPGCSKSEPAATGGHAENLPEMTVDDVDKGLAANTLTAIDCNGDGTRKRFGTLPGAILISDEEAFAASELPADKNRKLLFYCSGPT